MGDVSTTQSQGKKGQWFSSMKISKINKTDKVSTWIDAKGHGRVDCYSPSLHQSILFELDAKVKQRNRVITHMLIMKIAV